MNLAFLGTSSFAIPALSALSKAHDVSIVVTQPDRPAGRHARLQPSAVKEAAGRLNLEVFQPENINDAQAVARLRAAAPDAVVVVAYGQFLKSAIISLAPHGAINIHASLLPAYRGAAPINWAVIRGETKTGITTFSIDRGMDTGPILLQRSLPIEPDETAGELEPRLADLGAETLLETLAGLESRMIVPTAQPSDGVSYAPCLCRDDGLIDWSRPAGEIHDLVRGTNPWPGAWTTLCEERCKIHRTVRTDSARGEIPPGVIALPETGRLLVACGDRLLEVVEIQRQGRPRISGKQFLNGLRDRPSCFS